MGKTIAEILYNGFHVFKIQSKMNMQFIGYGVGTANYGITRAICFSKHDRIANVSKGESFIQINKVI